MRKTIGGILAAIIVAGGLLPVWGQSTPPESNVPQNHWAYDAMQALEQEGINAAAPHSSGRPAYTRRQMAEFTATLAAHASLRAGVGWPDSPGMRKGAADHDNLVRLAREFGPEMQTLGLADAAFQRALDRFHQVWQTGRPQGVEDPFPCSFSSRYRASERRDGARRADWEWRNGGAALYVEQEGANLPLDLSQAIPLSLFQEKPADLACEISAGHNTELWRLLKAQPDHDPRLTWLASVFDLENAWTRIAAHSLYIDAKHPGAIVPGTQMRLVWEEVPRNRVQARWDLGELPDGRLLAPKRDSPPTWRLVLDSPYPRTDIVLAVPLPSKPGSFQLAWGPSGSGICFIRTRVRDDPEMPFRLYAMDLRTGVVLNAAASAE